MAAAAVQLAPKVALALHSLEVPVELEEPVDASKRPSWTAEEKHCHHQAHTLIVNGNAILIINPG